MSFQTAEQGKYFGIVRHSSRLDGDPPWAFPELNEEWVDRDDRPYDTPISDYELPCSQAIGVPLQAYDFTRIISSPLRRCLQTAAVLASHLGLPEVDVSLDVAEPMVNLKRDGLREEADMTYVSRKEMLQIMKHEGVKLGTVEGEKPSFDEDWLGFKQRIGMALDALFTQAQDSFENVLIVAHADTVATAVEMINGQTVIQCEYCAWVVIESKMEAPPKSLGFCFGCSQPQIEHATLDSHGSKIADGYGYIVKDGPNGTMKSVTEPETDEESQEDDEG